MTHLKKRFDNQFLNEHKKTELTWAKFKKTETMSDLQHKIFSSNLKISKAPTHLYCIFLALIFILFNSNKFWIKLHVFCKIITLKDSHRLKEALIVKKSSTTSYMLLNLKCVFSRLICYLYKWPIMFYFLPYIQYNLNHQPSPNSHVQEGGDTDGEEFPWLTCTFTN